MACILALDVSENMLNVPKMHNKHSEDSLNVKPCYKYAIRGLLVVCDRIRKFMPECSIELIKYSSGINLCLHETNIINNIVLDLKTHTEFEGQCDIHSLGQVIDGRLKILKKNHKNISLIIVSQCSLEQFNTDPSYGCTTYLIELDQNLNQIVTKPSKIEKLYQCPFDMGIIMQLFSQITEEIFHTKRFVLKCQNFEKSSGYLFPVPSSLVYGSLVCYLESWRFKNNELTFKVLGFLDQEDMVYCVTQHRFKIYIDCNDPTKTTRPDLLLLLKVCLRLQKSSCIISMGHGLFGVIMSVRASKIDCLVLLVSNHDLPWLGPWNELGPFSKICNNPYEIDEQGLESSPFPLIEGVECSYCDNECGYLLTKPNFEVFVIYILEDVSILVKSMQKHGFHQSEFPNLKRLCSLYCMDGLTNIVKDMIIEKISQFSIDDQPLILEYFKNDETLVDVKKTD